MARYSKAQIAESLAHLRRLCPPGTTVLEKPTGGGGLSGVRMGRGGRLERVPRRDRSHRR